MILLKILTAIGKLNTKLISVIKIKPELSYYTAINNHLWNYPADVSVHLQTETDHYLTEVSNRRVDQKENSLLYSNSFDVISLFFKTIILKRPSLEIINLLSYGMDTVTHNSEHTYNHKCLIL